MKSGIFLPLLKGSGQVMFQENAWTGLLFLVGIFWGAYEAGQSAVAYGALVGLIVSTSTGYMLRQPSADGAAGLWGFNGILVGCAFPTFLSNTLQMWLALTFCSMLTTWARTGFNKAMAPLKANSLTFPFVFTTWIFLSAARVMDGMSPENLPDPELTAHASAAIHLSFGSLIIYWLKGIAQVFLINSWVTGLFFLAALLVSNRRAAAWAAIGSALSLAIVLLYQGNGSNIANGLFGFSPVLTAIALGCTFYRPNWRSTIWALIGIITTIFVQAGMDAMLMPFGIPMLTAPFCIATWLFLLPLYKFDNKQPNHTFWHKKKHTVR